MGANNFRQPEIRIDRCPANHVNRLSWRPGEFIRYCTKAWHMPCCATRLKWFGPAIAVCAGALSDNAWFYLTPGVWQGTLPA